MTSYLRPDDGIAHEAEMVEIRPGQFVSRDSAIRLGLAVNAVVGGLRETRAAASAGRAHEVGRESEQPGSVERPRPPVDRAASRRRPIEILAEAAEPNRVPEMAEATAARPGPSRSAVPPEVRTSPPAAPITPAPIAAPKVKRSLKEILADGRA